MDVATDVYRLGMYPERSDETDRDRSCLGSYVRERTRQLRAAYMLKLTWALSWSQDCAPV